MSQGSRERVSALGLRRPTAQSAPRHWARLVRKSLLDPQYALLHGLPLNVPIKLDFWSDLVLMTQKWTPEEVEAERRLVKFKFIRVLQYEFGVELKPIRSDQYNHLAPIILCIFWREKNMYIVTSVDIILILEFLVQELFLIEEKNRIRRNLQSLKTYTVLRLNKQFQRFFNLLMSMEDPRPRNIEQDLKVFRWVDLFKAISKVILKYSAVDDMQAFHTAQHDLHNSRGQSNHVRQHNDHMEMAHAMFRPPLAYNRDVYQESTTPLNPPTNNTNKDFQTSQPSNGITNNETFPSQTKPTHNLSRPSDSALLPYPQIPDRARQEPLAGFKLPPIHHDFAKPVKKENEIESSLPIPMESKQDAGMNVNSVPSEETISASLSSSATSDSKGKLLPSDFEEPVFLPNERLRVLKRKINQYSPGSPHNKRNGLFSHAIKPSEPVPIKGSNTAPSNSSSDGDADGEDPNSESTEDKSDLGRKTTSSSDNTPQGKRSKSGSVEMAAPLIPASTVAKSINEDRGAPTLGQKLDDTISMRLDLSLSENANANNLSSDSGSSESLSHMLMPKAGDTGGSQSQTTMSSSSSAGSFKKTPSQVRGLNNSVNGQTPSGVAHQQQYYLYPSGSAFFRPDKKDEVKDNSPLKLSTANVKQHNLEEEGKERKSNTVLPSIDTIFAPLKDASVGTLPGPTAIDNWNMHVKRTSTDQGSSHPKAYAYYGKPLVPDAGRQEEREKEG